MPASSLGRLREVVAYFGRLGVVGFGGPMAHIAMMERAVVEERGWLDRPRFLDALGATNLVPGPNSTEMAIHIGHRRAGIPGGVGAGLAFILPAFAMMLGLSWAYFQYGTRPALADAFYGMKPAVIALILATAYRLFVGGIGEPRRLMSRQADLRPLAIFAAAFGLGVGFPGFEVAVLVGAGLVGLVLFGPPLTGRPRVLGLAVLAVPVLAWEPDALVDLFLVCLRTGGLLFGGGYVMIPLLQGPVVDHFAWLTRQQFLDGVALGQTTPGPIVITATFIGYGAGGLAGAAVATLGIFLPAFVFAILASRFITSFGEAPHVRAALKGIGAAVVGTILAATVRLADSAFVDVWAVAVGVIALAVLLRWRAHSAVLIAGAALAGVILGAAGAN